MAPIAVLLVLTLTACATPPLRPDPGIDLSGDWRVTAVNGKAVPAGMSGFGFRYAPPYASARLGCNSGSGPARASNGWLVTGSGWIITTALCSEQRMRFARYELFERPLAIEPAGPDRVILRNARGSLVLQREPVPQLAGTRWRVLSINGRAAGPGATIHFTPFSYEANFGCNQVFGSFGQLADRLQLGMSMTERGCPDDTSPGGTPIHTFEDWGANVLAADPRVTTAGEGRVLLENRRGTIILQRMP